MALCVSHMNESHNVMTLNYKKDKKQQHQDTVLIKFHKNLASSCVSLEEYSV